MSPLVNGLFLRLSARGISAFGIVIDMLAADDSFDQGNDSKGNSIWPLPGLVRLPWYKGGKTNHERERKVSVPGCFC